MRYLAPQSARIDMGAQDDTVFAGIQRDSTKLLSQPTEIVSGSGNDLVSYRFAQRLTRTSLDSRRPWSPRPARPHGFA
jgi:hypothetical protein